MGRDGQFGHQVELGNANVISPRSARKREVLWQLSSNMIQTFGLACLRSKQLINARIESVTSQLPSTAAFREATITIGVARSSDANSSVRVKCSAETRVSRRIILAPL
eukprot:1660939-Rhodomonas_salina.1